MKQLWHWLQNTAASLFQQREWMYYKLRSALKALLLLSHGQATVERGFSVNMQVEIDYLSEDTFLAKCIICDHVIAVGGLQIIDTSISNCCWQLHQLDVSMGPTLKMKGGRRYQMAVSSEKL